MNEEFEKLVADTDGQYWGDALSSMSIRRALARAFELGREAALLDLGEHVSNGAGIGLRCEAAEAPTWSAII